MQSHWEAAVAAMEGHPADWSIWIHWYNRVLQDRDWYPERMHEVLKEIADGAWEKGPAHINPMFEEVLELYLADRRAISGSPNDARPTRHMRSIRAQVITLQDYLETEWRNLSGHNSRTEEQDEILELLNDLKALVEDMILRLGDAESDGRALVVVDENLPAIVEKTGALALVEAQPAVSETVALMSATIKSLVDAGADPKLATQIAMSEAAGSKLFTKIRRFFGK
jgi:predicted metal-dependent hydrolase